MPTCTQTMPHPKRKARQIPDIVNRQRNASVPNQTAATKYKHVKPKRETKNDDGQDNENPTNTTQNVVMEHTTNHTAKQIKNDKKENMSTSGQLVNSTSLVRKGNNQNHKPCLDVLLTHFVFRNHHHELQVFFC